MRYLRNDESKPPLNKVLPELAPPLEGLILEATPSVKAMLSEIYPEIHGQKPNKKHSRNNRLPEQQ